MADLFDIHPTGSPPHPAIVHRVRQMRFLLLEKLAAEHATLEQQLLPLLVDASGLLFEADVSAWTPEQLNYGAKEVTALATLARRVNELLELYREILSPSEAP